MQKIITVHFSSSGIPQPGLSPTIGIYELHATNPAINTLVVASGIVAEIGNGWYRYNFTTYDNTKNYVYTFDGGSSLQACERYKIGGNESYAEDISVSVWNEPALDHLGTGSTGLVLTQIKSDTASVMISQGALSTLLNTLLKYEKNRTKIDTTAATLTVYDDDCVTPLHVFNLKDHLGNPSVAEVCDRVPIGCGV